MKTKFLKIFVLAYTLLYTGICMAQENVFLNRGYWKENPSIAQIEKDIKAGNDIAELTANMFDAVCYALMEKTDNATIMHLLGKKGNEVDKLTHDGRTYMFWAAYRDNLEIMKFLVAKGAKANVEDSHGYSVLNFAAVTGQTNLELYDFLLAHNASINATNHGGANALLLVAPFAKDVAIIDYFVSKGLDLKSTDNKGSGIFHYAAKGGNIEILKYLIEKGVPYKNLNKEGSNAMLMASQGTRSSQNTLPTYEFLKSLGIKTNNIGDRERNPLHAIAYKSKDLDLYKYFIKEGVDVNKQDEGGDSPFMNAANSNTLEVVRFLHDYVVDLDVKDINGRSALAMAVNRNSPEVVQFLLDKKADINVVDKKGNTLAYYLANNFNEKNPEKFETKLKLLQSAGLDVNKKQHNGNTLVHLAAKENNLPLLKRLEGFNIDINQKNNEGNTALHLAAMTSNNDAVLKYLIENGADKTAKTEFDESVYDLAKENELLQHENVKLDFLKSE